MDPDARTDGAARERNGDLDGRTGMPPDQTPQEGRASVAQDSTFTAREHRRDVRRVLRLNGTNRIDAAMYRPQPTCCHAVVDQLRRDAGRDELVAPDHPMRSGQRQDPSFDGKRP